MLQTEEKLGDSCLQFQQQVSSRKESYALGGPICCEPLKTIARCVEDHCGEENLVDKITVSGCKFEGQVSKARNLRGGGGLSRLFQALGSGLFLLAQAVLAFEI